MSIDCCEAENKPSLTSIVNYFETRQSLHRSRYKTPHEQPELAAQINRLEPLVERIVFVQNVNEVYHIPTEFTVKYRDQFLEQALALPKENQSDSRPLRWGFEQAPNPLYTLRGLPILQRFWYHQQPTEAYLSYFGRCEEAIERGTLKKATSLKYFIVGLRDRQVALNLFLSEPKTFAEAKRLCKTILGVKRIIPENWVNPNLAKRNGWKKSHALKLDFETLELELTIHGGNKREKVTKWYKERTTREKSEYLEFWWKTAFRHVGKLKGYESAPKLRTTLWDPPLEIPCCQFELQDYVQYRPNSI